MRGFTLIELLVVITIIGILGAIGLNTFPQAQKQAKDQTRKSDINQYRTTIEAYANAHDGFYPGGAQNGIVATQLCTISDWANFANECPIGPSPNSSDSTYQYKYSADGASFTNPTSTKYVLWGKLETVTPATFWVVCSDGRSRNYQASSLSVSNGNCPL